MAFVSIANCWKVSVEGHYNTTLDKSANVYHVGDSGVRNTTAAALIAAAFQSWLNTSIKSHCVSAFTYDRVVVTDATDEHGTQLIYTTGFPIVGTNAGNIVGAQCTAVVGLKTALRGRSFRGRVYPPGLQNTYINAGDGCTLNASAQSTFNSDWQALVTAIAALGAPTVTPFLGVGSKKLGVVTPVSFISTAGRLGTQRRRVAA